VANAAPELPSTPSLRGVPALLSDRASLGAVVLAASIPFVFLHEQHQRWGTFGIDVGSTTVDVRPSDLAVLLVVVAAVAAAVRLGTDPLLQARWLWIFGAALLVWLAFQALRPAALDDDEFSSHFVTFAKLCEYALLAVAVPLLVRRRDDLVIFLGALVLWSVVATAVGLTQFFGLDVFDAWNAGWRQPSFLGHHDFAALSAIALSTAAGGIVAARRNLPVPALFVPALVAGLLGLVLAGSVAAVGGLTAGMLAVAIASRQRFAPSARQLAALAAIVLAVAGGVAAVRGDALEDFLRFLGVRDDEPVGVETYSQRTVLAYIGLRIFQDNPIAGVGWQRSSTPEVFEPYVPDARKRFPDVVELAFPSRENRWGVQNLYIQLLADAGIVGLALLLAVGAAGLLLAWRTARHGPRPWAVGAGLVSLGALLTLAGEWASLGIVSGIPIQAATSLMLGLAAAGAASVEDDAL
jgi:O-antigen ligase